MIVPRLRLQILISALALFISSVCTAQDRIITTTGDTIQCEITRVTDEFIHYQQSETTRSRIPSSEVASYFWTEENEVEEVETKGDSPTEPTTETKTEKKFSRVRNNLRLALDIGIGYRVSQASDVLPSSFIRDLRSMLHLGGSLHYFLPNGQGIGGKFTRVHTKVDGTFPTIGTTLQDITMVYAGISFLNRKLLSDRGTNFYYGFGVGLLSYNNDAIENGTTIIVDGNTFGVGLELGFDHAISGTMLVGINLSATIGTLEDYTINGVNSNAIRAPSESLTRMDLTIGIRFTR